MAIKQAVDASNARGQFLITGSANVLTSRAVADALPGRVEYVNLWPLSQGEIEGHREVFVDRLLAARSGNLAAFSRLSRELELDSKTVKAHTAMLEELFLVHRLRPWSRNLGSRHVKTPKLFVADTGLASALIGVGAQRYAAVDQGELAGMLLETFVTPAGDDDRIWAVPLAGLWADHT